MDARRKTTLVILTIAAIAASALVTNTVLSAASAGAQRNTTCYGTSFDAPRGNTSFGPYKIMAFGRFPPQQGFPSGPMPSMNNRYGNLTINSEQAKALVQAGIPSFRVGTVSSVKTSWTVPIEDDKGVVTLIQVTKVSASTAEQAKAVVERSLAKGWKAGEAQLVRSTYQVTLLDSTDVAVGYVRVDGLSGQIIRSPSTILEVTSEEAKTIVNDAIRSFEVGNVTGGGGTWIVTITYQDKAIMTVVMGKLNTPTSGDAAKAARDSLAKGWSAGEPRRLWSAHSVPIIDANQNTVGYVNVDARSGNLVAQPSIPMIRR